MTKLKYLKNFKKSDNLIYCTDFFSKKLSPNKFVLYKQLNNSIYEIEKSDYKKQKICSKSLFFIIILQDLISRRINSSFIIKYTTNNFTDFHIIKRSNNSSTIKCTFFELNGKVL